MPGVIPQSELSKYGVLCRTRKGQEYNVTQSIIRGALRFTLWRKTKDGYTKLDVSNSPIPLYKKIPW